MAKKKMFGKNLKFLREKNGLEQSHIADMLDKKSTSAVSEWEKGLRIPNIGDLDVLSTIFHVTIDNLVNSDLSAKEEPTETEELAQLMEELHKNPDLRILMSTSSKVTPDSLRALINLAQNMKEKDE